MEVDSLISEKHEEKYHGLVVFYSQEGIIEKNKNMLQEISWKKLFITLMEVLLKRIGRHLIIKENKLTYLEMISTLNFIG